MLWHSAVWLLKIVLMTTHISNFLSLINNLSSFKFYRWWVWTRSSVLWRSCRLYNVGPVLINHHVVTWVSPTACWSRWLSIFSSFLFLLFFILVYILSNAKFSMFHSCYTFKTGSLCNWIVTEILNVLLCNLMWSLW